MQCDRVLNLIDPYVDGELAGALASEVAAHCVRCADCGRALALAQVTASVIASGRGEPALDDDFTDRLLACVEQRRPLVQGRRRRWLVYGVASSAAAAVLAIAFSLPGRERPTAVLGQFAPWPLDEPPTASGAAVDRPAADWQRVAAPFEHGINRTHDLGVSLQRSFEAAMTEMLRSLEAQTPSKSSESATSDDPAGPPKAPATEDL